MGESMCCSICAQLVCSYTSVLAFTRDVVLACVLACILMFLNVCVDEMRGYA